ncbi:glycosyltransferase family 2 protein [Nitrosopumilus sp. S4]
MSKISIGLPVYNGENFLNKCLTSLLDQSFSDFEIIISDNASIDNTSQICKKFQDRDSRIRYFRHSKNKGAIWNFNFVLGKAVGNYFVFAAVDDYWSTNFLERNIAFLERNNDYVGCAGKVEYYGNINKKLTTIQKLKNIERGLIKKIRPSISQSIEGNYAQRVRTLFKKSTYVTIYGLFRIDELRKSIVEINIIGPDVIWLLNILRFGNIKVQNDVFLYKYNGGLSTKGNLKLARELNDYGLIGYLFPHYPLTKWCFKNLKPKLFFQNIDHFIVLNIASEFFVLLEIINILLKKIYNNKILNKDNSIE